jgi:predicted transcriptional regulator
MTKEPARQIDVCCEHCDGTGLVTVIHFRWLRWKRERAGISLREMARRLGFSAAYVSDFERGNRQPPVKVIDDYESI